MKSKSVVSLLSFGFVAHFCPSYKKKTNKPTNKDIQQQTESEQHISNTNQHLQSIYSIVYSYTIYLNSKTTNNFDTSQTIKKNNHFFSVFCFFFSWIALLIKTRKITNLFVVCCFPAARMFSSFCVWILFTLICIVFFDLSQKILCGAYYSFKLEKISLQKRRKRGNHFYWIYKKKLWIKIKI